MVIYHDRSEAGEELASHLSQYAGQSDIVVLALPRGGVPVAFEVAQALDAPMDILLVRKLGVPGHEELAMGAIASGGVRVLNQSVVRALKIPETVINDIALKEQQELERREQAYRDNRPAVPLEGKTVILIDDGLATGASMQAAVEGVKVHHPKSVVVAVPVASTETCGQFTQLVNEVVCANTPEPFYGVGLWYEEFPQMTDQEVRDLLSKAAQTGSQQSSKGKIEKMAQGQKRTHLVHIQTEDTQLEGNMTIPDGATGIVAFVHGSGSSRKSSRNRFVAEELHKVGLATLLFDLLTEEEERVDQVTRQYRFNIDLLARRTQGAVEWLHVQQKTKNLSVGLFGASTGAAAALIAATKTQSPEFVGAIVSRGGRPDLAGDSLLEIHVPTLFLIGSNDDVIIQLNEEAYEMLSPTMIKEMRIIPGATHLFEEPGALEAVAHEARDWFLQYLQQTRGSTMADKTARQKLLDLIDEKAFNPVLNAQPEDFSANKQDKLNDVKSTTRSTQKRYHENYHSAEEVYQNYKDDLSSDAAQDVDRELRDLNLPTLKDIEEEVEKMAEEVGLKGQS